MTVSSLTNIGLQTSNQNASSSQSAASLSQNFDTFLTLLTTQLKNQDPTSPMESDKFTDQLSQFAQVEQGIQTNKNLENLLTMQGQQRQLSALSYVGAQIEAVGDTNWHRAGETMDFKYSISPEVPSAQLQIVDQDGKTVYSETVTDVSGVQSFTWNGKDNSGTDQEEGAYTLVVKPLGDDGDTFKDSKGKAATVSIGIVGKVDSVDIGDDDIYLRIGDVSVPFATLTNVKLASNSDENSGTGSTGNEGDDTATDDAA
ncbi:flagellar hook assembly protein FlgD [Thalassospira marina]|uniref:Basal-body rod modification protein FlgD n=1 Tax=Thalassospira marina TaxID=2048283 RepID=A0A2N3KZJ7_9PROT|nr:flagellar hook capping FlgD N-terminal domain-containing protein [Thalassospira marina]AUG51988.1 flagellar biosynthesis protein FlgD [Thalassospira marina]PKR55917.1 flagellar biosynthesis protein FlgD [Thalassospira marina]